jgi:gamma-glutamyl hercynylcysteine S-oxide synthase
VATSAQKTSGPSGDVEHALRGLEQAREHTLSLVEHVSDDDLERVHSPIMSPLAWDLAHIAAYEDLWLAQRHGGLELLRGDLAALYDAFETPRAARGEVDALGARDARKYMSEVRGRVVELLEREGAGDGSICEMVTRHELQHCETMRQTLAIAGLLKREERALIEEPLARAEREAWIALDAGPFAMGAREECFAYDNERPRHTREVDAFRIARRPVTNASWMRFSEGGGYVRREWWSDEGWAWKEQQDITHHPSVADGRPDAPVCHVSWFEADAFARAHDARLPSEQEWEKAATWTHEDRSQEDRGEGPVLVGLGRVWEWTASYFRGYPGFTAFPYREYSEVFFGEGYRVLRGGSWATHRRVKSTTFRNWDLPERRQIFAGLRLARDA